MWAFSWKKKKKTENLDWLTVYGVVALQADNCFSGCLIVEHAFKKNYFISYIVFTGDKGGIVKEIVEAVLEQWDKEMG